MRPQPAAASDVRTAASSELHLAYGASNVEVLRVLGSQTARVLRLTDAEGAFDGWDSNHDEGYLFNKLEQFFLLGGDWCCSSREANQGRLYPLDPPKLRVVKAARPPPGKRALPWSSPMRLVSYCWWTVLLRWSSSRMWKTDGRS